MNENEIRNMEAGREMDALIMEMVMGYARQRRGYSSQYDWALVKADAKPTYLLPQFSRDIAAAWQVVEKMIGGEYEISMANREDREGYSFWGVDFYTMIDEAALDACFSADAPTASLAICRAALLAVLGNER